MTRHAILAAAYLSCSAAFLSAQMGADAHKGPETTHRAPSKPSTELTVTGTDGKSQHYSVEDVKNLPHLSVTVNNAHTKTSESYAGVPLSALIKRSEPELAGAALPKNRAGMTILIAGATDNFHTVLTLCDADPSCHNGMVLVADQMDGKPLTDDGAFKLIITEDKKPSRWARNLNSITIKVI